MQVLERVVTRWRASSTRGRRTRQAAVRPRLTWLAGAPPRAMRIALCSHWSIVAADWPAAQRANAVEAPEHRNPKLPLRHLACQGLPAAVNALNLPPFTWSGNGGRAAKATGLDAQRVAQTPLARRGRWRAELAVAATGEGAEQQGAR